MTLEEAIKLTRSCNEQMAARYQKPVFDEWAIVSLADNKGHLLSYTGPRKEDFQKNFVTDAGTLRAGLMKDDQTVGDFEFSRHSVGTGFEAFLVAGRGIFLICNNTQRTMDEIARDPLWLNAQVPFVEMSDKFRDNPLALR
jgi:hypothetical protein